MNSNVKRPALVFIVEILKKYSNEQNPITHQEISRKLEEEYDLILKPRSVEENLTVLMNEIDKLNENQVESIVPDFEIHCIKTEYPPGTNKKTVYEGWYILPEFEESEIKYVIDSIIFSKYLSDKHTKELVRKLSKLGGPEFNTNMQDIKRLVPKIPENRSLFWNIETLVNAIKKKQKVKFNFCRYDKKPGDTGARLVMEEKNGEPREYIINPYELIAANGKYYVLCSHDSGNKLYKYRIDLIKNIEIIKERQRPAKEFDELKNTDSIARYLKEHIYLYGEESVRAVVRIDQDKVGSLIEWFGSDINIRMAQKGSDDNTVEASFMVNEQAMRYWALQYGNHVEVLQPASLREKIRGSITDMAKKYEVK